MTPPASTGNLVNRLEVLAICTVPADVATRRLGLEDWEPGGYEPLRRATGASAGSTGTDAWLLPALRELLRGTQVRRHRRAPAHRPCCAPSERCSIGHAEIPRAQCWSPPGDRERTWLMVHLRVPVSADEDTDELNAAALLLRDLAPRAGYTGTSPCLLQRLATDAADAGPDSDAPTTPRATSSPGTEDLIIEHKGLLVFAHGPRFHVDPPSNLVAGVLGGHLGRPSWSPEHQWLWWLSECVSATSTHQHGMPITIEKDVIDFEGHLLYVGTRATVLVDDPAQQVVFDKVWENQFDVLLTDAMLLATYQRDRLYGLANRLLSQERAPRADLRMLWRQLSEFRRAWWWVSTGISPDNAVLQSYQRAHRLPELMDQLVHEVHDYREHEELRLAAILNWSVAAFAILSIAGAVGELASGYGSLGRTWAWALSGLTGAALLVVLMVARVMRGARRQRAHRTP